MGVILKLSAVIYVNLNLNRNNFDMALRVNSRKENLPVGGKVGGTALPTKLGVGSKPGLKAGLRSRAALGTLTNKTTTSTVRAGKPRTTRVARRLLKNDASEVEAMDLDALNIQEINYKEEVERRAEALRQDLPEGVIDIDKDDIENPQLCYEYAPAMFAYLKSIEDQYIVKSDYLAGLPTTGKMRTVLVDWLVDVQQQFKLLQETLFLSVSIIDRFMNAEGAKISRDHLQLVGISAMFLASKLEEIYAPELNDFVYITDNAYTSKQVRDMELRIIKSLGFNFGSPLSINFLRRFSKAGDVDVTQHALAKYILETMLLDYNLVDMTPSLCAATALYLSLGILEPEDTDLWTPTLQHYTGYTNAQVHDKVKLAISSLKKADCGKYTAIKQKYSTRVMQKIAVSDQLKLKLNLL